MRTLPRIVESVLHTYKASLDREFPGRVLRVALFGSTARGGEANEDSDVDVLILVDRLTFAERSRIIDLGTLAGLDARLNMAPLVLTSAEWSTLVDRERALPREIERDGVSL